jgi:hypothetical protein
MWFFRRGERRENSGECGFLGGGEKKRLFPLPPAGASSPRVLFTVLEQTVSPLSIRSALSVNAPAVRRSPALPL